MTNINSVVKAVAALSLTMVDNGTICGAKNGSQFKLEQCLADMVKGRAFYSLPELVCRIAGSADSFKTSVSAQKAPKAKGLTLEGLDAEKTMKKVVLNIKYLAGLESGENGRRHIKVWNAFHAVSKRPAFNAAMADLLTLVKEIKPQLVALKGNTSHKLEWSEIADQFALISKKNAKGNDTDLAYFLREAEFMVPEVVWPE